LINTDVLTREINNLKNLITPKASFLDIEELKSQDSNLLFFMKIRFIKWSNKSFER